jgi:phage RecT family recombinase
VTTQTRRQQPEIPHERAMTVGESEKKAMERLTVEIAKRESQLTALLAGQIDQERFITVALQAVQSQPALLRCTTLSLLGAIRDAATYGLEPAGMLGDAAIVPYREVATLRIEYRGLRKLAMRDGTVLAIDSDLVYDGDDFAFFSGSDPKVHHAPALERAADANIRGGYAWARLKSGELLTLWMTLPEILQRRDASPDYRRAERDQKFDSIWHKWPKEQMKKTVLRRFIVEKLPMTPIAREAIAQDTLADVAASPLERETARVAAGGAAKARLLGRFGLEDEKAAGQPDSDAAGEPASEPADSTPEPAAAESGPQDAEFREEPAICGAASPYDAGGCVRPKDHEAGTHADRDGQTWML